MRIAVATDHAGFPLKGPIIDFLRAAGHEPVDFGTDSTEPVDYPDFIAPAARAVASGDCHLGIALGGSGTGEQIVANKVRGIRCVESTDPVTARLAREHNDANMLAMGARIIGAEEALGCVAAFLAGEFQGGRHARRVEKISRLEAEFCAGSTEIGAGVENATAAVADAAGGGESSADNAQPASGTGEQLAKG